MAYARVDLPLHVLSREQLAEYLERPNLQARQARHMLDVLAAGGTLPDRYVAPVALWRLGDGPTLVALPGEPVAEYARLLREALGREGVWVAGYSNDCFGYLPTARVVEEGGHEAIGVTLWAWGRDLGRQVGFFEPRVQEVIVEAVRRLAAEADRAPGRETTRPRRANGARPRSLVVQPDAAHSSSIGPASSIPARPSTSMARGPSPGRCERRSKPGSSDNPAAHARRTFGTSLTNAPAAPADRAAEKAREGP